LWYIAEKELNMEGLLIIIALQVVNLYCIYQVARADKIQSIMNGWFINNTWPDGFDVYDVLRPSLKNWFGLKWPSDFK
jgi:hypothetical protein